VTFTPLRNLPDTLVEITVNGRPVAARAGIPLALALLEGGLEAFNRSPVDGTPRRPYCLMGACLECRVVVNGCRDVISCLRPVEAGLAVETQDADAGRS